MRGIREIFKDKGGVGIIGCECEIKEGHFSGVGMGKKYISKSSVM